MDKNFTVDEVAKQLKVSKRTILRAIKKGSLEAKKIGKRYLVSERNLKNYLGESEADVEKEIEKFLISKKAEMVTLLQKLISMETEDSSFGQEERLARYVSKLFRKNNIRSVLYEKDGCAAVRGTFGYADDGFLLDCPLDTTTAGDVSHWKYPPYDGVIKAGKMYGRGTADCKAGIVCMIYTLLALKKYIDEEKVRVEVVFDGGEQNGEYHGMKLVLGKGLPVKAGIVGYAGDNDTIPIGARGYHRYTFTIHGKSAHTGSSSIRGINAIDKMVNFIYEFNKIKLPKSNDKRFPQGSRKTYSVINGGSQINIVPDKCVSRLDVRTTPDLDKNYLDNLIEEFIDQQKKKDKYLEIEYQHDVGKEAFVLDEKEPLVNILSDIVPERIGHNLPKVSTGPAHVGNLLSEYDIPIVVWGPRGGNVHSYDEYIEIDSLVPTAQVYALTVLKYFGIE